MSKGFGQGSNDIVTCPVCGKKFFSKGFGRHARVCAPHHHGRKFEVKVSGETVATFTSKTKAYDYAAALRETK